MNILTFLKDVGISFIPIFIATDAIGTLPFVLSMTQDMSPSERKRVISYAMLTAFLLGMGFIGIGKGILLALGIQISDFLIAGGLILLALSIRHLMTNKWVELQVTGPKEIIGVVPIGTPLVVGPAVLTTLLLLIDQYGIGAVVVSLVLNLAIAWAIFSQANRVASLLRAPGLRAASLIASLLLAAIGVAMIRRGVLGVIR